MYVLRDARCSPRGTRICWARRAVLPVRATVDDIILALLGTVRAMREEIAPRRPRNRYKVRRNDHRDKCQESRRAEAAIFNAGEE